MPTNNPRINITLDKASASELARLADIEDRTVASLAKELIFEALERREDLALSTLAISRDTKKTKRVKHQDVWK